MPTAAKVNKGEARGHPSKEVLTRYFTKVKLSNVKTFASEVELDLCHSNGRIAQWTILLGENGTGKTTLLQYIGSLHPEGSNLVDTTKMANGETLPRLRPMAINPTWFTWHAENIRRPWPREGNTMDIAVDLSSPSDHLNNLQVVSKTKRENPSDPFEYSYRLPSDKMLIKVR